MESEVHGAIYLLILERSSMDELVGKKGDEGILESSRVESNRGVTRNLHDPCHGAYFLLFCIGRICATEMKLDLEG